MRVPHVFANVAEALASLQADKLGTVYYRALEVFVATCHGTGSFTHKDWREHGGHKNSLEEKVKA